MNIRSSRIPGRLALGIALALAAGSALAHPGWRDRDGDGRGDAGDDGWDAGRYARVLDARPHYVDVRVDVPEQRCWSDRGASRGDDRHRVGGTLLGGLLGGVIGHNIGDGDGRGVSTAAGVVIGSVIGHQIGAAADERDGRYGRDDGDDGRYGRGDRDERYAQHCRTVLRPSYERRIEGYDVVYEYAGRRYQTRLAYDPGPRLAVAPTWR
jgi:uncharacterized protein YcfJ